MQDDVAEYLPTDQETEFILDAAAAGTADLDSLAEQAGKSMDPQTADTIEELRPFGELLGLQPDTSRSVEVYRKRILAKYQQLSVTGRPNEVLNFITFLFNIDPGKVTIKNPDGQAYLTASLPTQVLENTLLTSSEISSLIEDVTAAGLGAEIQRVGTLDYISETELNNGNYDASKGYATLDANGNVTSGGTYGTVF
jgi:hypothetical protein